MRSSLVFRREGIKFSIDANMSLIPLFLGSLSSPVCLLLIWISCIIFFLCCQTPFKVFVFLRVFLNDSVRSEKPIPNMLTLLCFLLQNFAWFGCTGSLGTLHFPAPCPQMRQHNPDKFSIDSTVPWEESHDLLSAHFSFIPHSHLLIAYRLKLLKDCDWHSRPVLGGLPCLHSSLIQPPTYCQHRAEETKFSVKSSQDMNVLQTRLHSKIRMWWCYCL